MKKLLLYISPIIAVIFIVSCKPLTMPIDTSDVAITYDTIVKKKELPKLSPIQIKYGKILNVKPDSITNIKLYTFIDEWMNRPYLLGGETKDGIDCSSFTQLLYINVYGLYVERTAEKQFKSKNTSKFKGQEFFKEGDLVFFQPGNKERRVTHVGVYLKNGKFVNSTSFVKDTGGSGVKISSLQYPFWEKRYLAGGKRKEL